MELRPYQWEVIMPALEGKNIIIWLPTGAGKTRAAAYVAKRHLETVDRAKVVVLVNRVHLVSQHREEFSRMLDKGWAIITLSGDMGPRAGFGHLARSHDLIICTAELLQMALTSPEEEEHVELNALCQPGHVAHHVTADLPPPAAGAQPSALQTVQPVLQAQPGPVWGHTEEAHGPNPQPPGDARVEPGLRDAELRAAAAKAGLQQRRVYALHLRRYNDALLVHDTVRPVDALDSLRDFYDRERATKTQVLQAERWLLALFDDYKNELAHLATCSLENPKLEMLEQILREQFGSSDSPRGIIFTQTRQSAHSLLLWLRQQPGLQTMDMRADLLIGAGNSSQNSHMTQRDQQEVIRKFRVGTLNLLVATSVAEEGLDIPQCNVVVRYGLLTNEISMVQARGRARAGQSTYSFVATRGSRELRRELTNEVLETLMERAVAAVQKMDQAEYQAKIRDLQRAAVVKRAARAAQRENQRQQFLAEQVQLLCVNCMVAVGHGSDLRKVEDAHHVNVNPNFSIYYTVSQGAVVIDRVFKDWRPGGTIHCRNCGEAWGLQMIYKSVKLPALRVRSMLLETPRGRVQAKKWSRVPFPVPDFDYLLHCAQNLASLSLD
ncbi:ATP-dependent RNA helicase DHX58 isoform X3 [Halichoerus grypus]